MWFETLDDGTAAVRGDINVDDFAFTTMKKIQDSFPECRWEELIGGSTAERFYRWKNGELKVKKSHPGRCTNRERKKFIGPALEKALGR